ncbi:protein ASPARTIC PROTEASE IN GUARD CELL 1-like [Capsicum galapagoense]
MEKFLQIQLLISIIFSIFLLAFGNEKSLLSLNSSYIMEARKRFMSIDLTKLPDPPMPSYMFTLFSRDLFEKSKFKDYDSLLESKVSRSQARVSHLASILGNGNSIGANGNLMRPHIKHESKTADAKVPETTSTYYVNGEYVASFTIGGEQIKNYLLIDTGSDLIWWQCKPCTEGGCYNQADPIYAAPNSGTYEKLDCVAKSESCFTSNLISCDQRTRECIYDVTYADKRRTKGWIAGDVITFVLDQNQERILFGCGRDQTSGDGSFGPEYAGIAGLGRRVLTSGYSLPSQFEADIMSMCLPGLHSESATISFHTTPFDNSISAELLPNPAYPNFYFVNLYKVFINEREIPLNPSIAIESGCVVDTGTVITNFPRDIYNVFRDTFRQEVQDLTLVDNPTPGAFDTCYNVDLGVVPNFPIVRMHFSGQNPNNMVLLTHQQVVTYFHGLYCLAFHAWDEGFTILGNYQLQGIGLTFNTAENTLSFQLNVCD